MSMEFDTPEEAREFGIAMAGCDPAATELTEDPDLKVSQGAILGVDTDEDLSSQRGYRFKNVSGLEVGIVVAPFRDGWCCWGVFDSIARRF